MIKEEDQSENKSRALQPESAKRVVYARKLHEKQEHPQSLQPPTQQQSKRRILLKLDDFNSQGVIHKTLFNTQESVYSTLPRDRA